MYKTKKIKIEKEVDIISEINCNKCGKCLYQNDTDKQQKIDLNRFGAPYDFIDYNGETGEANIFSFHFGYFSKKFGDGATFILTVCEQCLFDFVESCKIPPEFI